MRIIILFVLLALVLTGCGTNNNDKREGNNAPNNRETELVSNEGQESPDTRNEQSDSGTFWEKLIMNAVYDKNGTVTAEIPLPSGWKINAGHAQGEPIISGPHGIKVTDFPAQSFMYTNNQGLQRSYYQSGQQLRAMPGIEQVIQQDIIPWCTGQGLQFIKYYEIPEITKIDKWYNDQLYKAVPTQTDLVAIGTDWKLANGDPYFLIVHLFVGNSEYLQTWYYSCTGLQAEKSQFEKAKKQLIFGIVNTYYPLEPIMAYNRMEAEKAGQSWAAHNQRMAQNQANFEASQRAFVNKSNAINDAIMNGWRERNAASDRSHEQFLDVITERTNVVDPSSGKKYKVASGSNQYWMNSSGEYIGTRHQDYNPNLDENLNREKWQELKEVK